VFKTHHPAWPWFRLERELNDKGSHDLRFKIATGTKHEMFKKNKQECNHGRLKNLLEWLLMNYP
jgi:hypothetical protein